MRRRGPQGELRNRRRSLNAVEIARKRLGEAMRLHEAGHPSYMAAVALQVAVEQHMIALWHKHGFGPFPHTGGSTHRDYIEAARRLAAAGLVSGELPIIAEQLAEGATARYRGEGFSNSTVEYWLETVSRLLGQTEVLATAA